MKVMVLGARPGNIGGAIAEELGADPKVDMVRSDDCLSGGCLYSPPPPREMRGWDALVVTLGHTHMEPFTSIEFRSIQDVIDGSLQLPLEAALNFVRGTEDDRRLLEGEGGSVEHDPRSIVFIGSYAHRHPFTNGTAYCAAKAGLDMAVKTLGWELTDKGYRIHIVHPYHVSGTPMWERVEEGLKETRGFSDEEVREHTRRDLKMPDMLTPQEVAQTVRWLLTEPSAGWTSGTAIELFGGSR